MTDDRLDVAVEMVAAHVIERLLDDEILSEQWENYDEIGGYDWIKVTEKVRETRDALSVSDVAYEAAYNHLKSRADAE